MNKRIDIEEGDEDQGTIIPALPHHDIYEILARLPLKSLMRFKSVSKEWLYTIHDQSLATEFSIHRSQIHTAAPTCLLSFFPLVHNYYSLDLDSGLLTPFQNLNQPEFEGAEVLKTVMGLTCFEAKGITYFWNLRTREITALPQTEPDFPVNSEVLSFSSLGFDPVKGQYKILKTWSLFDETSFLLPSKTCHKVITLGTSEWRKINNEIDMGGFASPVFVDGKLHNLTYDMHRNNIVATFHVGNEKFEVIEIPQENIDCRRLIPYGDCLAFVDFYCNPGNEAVIMILAILEDGKWVVKHVELPQGLTECNIHASGINSTGEILLTPIDIKGQFYVYRYNVEKNSIKEVEVHGLPDGLHMVDLPPVEYEESILSLKKLNPI